VKVWATIGLLAAGTFLLKAAGPILLGGRRLPPVLDRLVALLPASLLAALVLIQTVGRDREVVLDARLAGVAAAAVCIWRRQGFLVVVAAAMAATAVARAVGAG
jgi:branched-subunit amino acid transport protein